MSDIIEGYTNEQIAKIIEQGEKRKERQKLQTKKQVAKTRLYIRKAKEMGIVVSEQEIDDEINR